MKLRLVLLIILNKHFNANSLQALLRGALLQQSAVILVCMAVDRYICALHPKRYHLHSSKKVFLFIVLYNYANIVLYSILLRLSFIPFSMKNLRSREFIKSSLLILFWDLEVQTHDLDKYGKHWKIISKASLNFKHIEDLIFSLSNLE